jgi:murein DD-endopeptidase MepM/ murein hydrolase activator NlpD
VKVGDMVKKDQSLGQAGATGLALGVHVHFSMQIDGVQINPREWWDEHWIHDRIMSKLAPDQAAKLEGAPAAAKKVEVTATRRSAKKRKR